MRNVPVENQEASVLLANGICLLRDQWSVTRGLNLFGESPRLSTFATLRNVADFDRFRTEANVALARMACLEQ